MSSNKTQSLLESHIERNPEVNVEYCNEGTNTTSKLGNWLRPREIEPWYDFELNSLDSRYDGSSWRLLNSEFALDRFDSIPSLPFREIHDEDSLEALLVKWNHSVVSQALTLAQQHVCNDWQYDKIFMVKGGQAKIPAPLSRVRPDWGAIQRAAEDTNLLVKGKSDNILPGETKLSIKWHISWIRHGRLRDHDLHTQWLLPIRQILTYCVRCNARYGYLITDQELFVIRGRPGSISDDANTDSQGASVKKVNSQDSYKEDADTPAHQAESSGIIEYKAIPWVKGDHTSKQELGLTVNLALWWLHMMAAKDSSIALAYEPMSTEKLPSTAQSLHHSFGVSNIGYELENISFDRSLTGSFQSIASSNRRKR